MSRATGVDVVTGEGLDEALAGVEVVVDAATGPSPDQEEATAFFTASARNLQEAGRRAGVQRIVVVSIIGIDKYSGGYQAAKVAQERAMQARPGPGADPARRAVPRVRRGAHDVGPAGRRQLPAEDAHAAGRRPHGGAGARRSRHRARTDAALISEIAGPREEDLVDAAKLLAARRGDPAQVEAASGDPSDPDHGLFEAGANLPGPDATLAGPTFEEWLDSTR